ncbi:MAG: sulfatase [Planctomycetaceae bacterium]
MTTDRARMILLVLLVGCVATATATAASPNLQGFQQVRRPGWPHLVDLMRAGLRFQQARVQVGNCMPSRNVMWSGRYPHTNGVQGFQQVRRPGWPHLVDLMRAGGYFTGIRGKVSHSTPYHPYGWDVVLDSEPDNPHIKDAASYGESTRRGIELSREAGRPFCLVINVSDPHKPFYGMTKRSESGTDPHPTSRVFSPDEVPIPGFLFDHPEVRRELAHYYSSVRRADDAVGAILDALRASGAVDETFVMFLSDHGMPLPFAKTALWHHSTHTPLIIRWPQVTRPGSVDDSHLVSAIDFLPTLLDVAGVEHPPGLQGRSFLPLVKGEPSDGWDMTVTEYHENSGGFHNPMRSVHTERFGYIYNPWSNGERTFKTATTGTLTYRTMQQLAETNDGVAARLRFFDLRVPEEFYDYQNDPDGLHNLIGDPAFALEIERHRELLRDWMRRTDDPLREAFTSLGDAAAQEAYMQSLEPRRPRKTPANRQRRSEEPIECR